MINNDPDEKLIECEPPTVPGIYKTTSTSKVGCHGGLQHHKTINNCSKTFDTSLQRWVFNHKHGFYSTSSHTFIPTDLWDLDN